MRGINLEDTAAERRKTIATAEGRGKSVLNRLSRGAAKDSVAALRLIDNNERNPRPSAVATLLRRSAATL
jgi:hypothetical protein